MAKSFRKERLNERLKELLGDLILSQVKDPRIGLVTITSTDVASDLTVAKVYFTVMGDEEARVETKQGLESAKNFFRKSIGRELKLRQVPDLRFVYDDTLDKSLRIEDALNKMHENEEGE
jgi:ribosome-binding factor A